jgi:hypothetical protein
LDLASFADGNGEKAGIESGTYRGNQRAVRAQGGSERKKHIGSAGLQRKGAGRAFLSLPFFLNFSLRPKNRARRVTIAGAVFRDATGNFH